MDLAVLVPTPSASTRTMGEMTHTSRHLPPVRPGIAPDRPEIRRAPMPVRLPTPEAIVGENGGCGAGEKGGCPSFGLPSPTGGVASGEGGLLRISPTAPDRQRRRREGRREEGAATGGCKILFCSLPLTCAVRPNTCVPQVVICDRAVWIGLTRFQGSAWGEPTLRTPPSTCCGAHLTV